MARANRSAYSFLGVSVVAGVLVAACGGGDDQGVTTPDATTGGVVGVSTGPTGGTKTGGTTGTKATGGATTAATGGAKAVGGTSAAATGGTKSTGGAPAVGGTTATATGGAPAVGGTSTAGGATSVGGTSTAGGVTSVGGTSTAGGATSVGGTSTAGGVTSVGGTSTAGGATAVGGTSTAGGASATGGSKAVGGTSTAGGASATGGSNAVGGSSATGGSSAMAPCTTDANTILTCTPPATVSPGNTGTGAARDPVNDPYIGNYQYHVFNGVIQLYGDITAPGRFWQGSPYTDATCSGRGVNATGMTGLRVTVTNAAAALTLLLYVTDQAGTASLYTIVPMTASVNVPAGGPNTIDVPFSTFQPTCATSVAFNAATIRQLGLGFGSAGTLDLTITSVAFY